MKMVRYEVERRVDEQNEEKAGDERNKVRFKVKQKG